MSTTIIIFSYPKLLSFSVLTFIKWRLTPSYAAKDKKDPKLSLSELLSRITRIQIYSYDLLCEPVLSMRIFRNNKQHVVLGQKIVSTRGRKRTLTDSERKMNRSEVSSKWGSVGPLEQTQGSATRPNSRSKWQRFCLIGKPSMFFPSFLNRFSYFLNLWWYIMIIFGR